MNLTLNPYLNFNGNAAEAMKFYHGILGGDLSMQTFGQAKMAVSPAEEGRIVHAALRTEGFSLMASDRHQDDKATPGDNVHLSLMGEDGDRLTEIFDKLGQGGVIDMLLAKQFWGDSFGMLTDKFGVHWMVNIAQAQG